MERSAPFVAALLLAGFAVASANAELPDWLSGKALLGEYQAVGSEKGTLQSGLTVYGVAAPSFSEDYSAKLALRGSTFRRSLEKGDAFIFRGEAQELWFARAKSGLDLRVGQIVTPWGRSDAVNPTDFLTAKDLTFLSTSDQIRRRGAPGFRASYVPNEGNSPVEATVAWNARYPQTKMLLPNAGVPGGLSVETDPESPRWFGDRQEWALKFAFLASAYDFSVSAFSGRDHFGQFVWDGTRVELVFEKERALGADFSITFDDFVLRGESAYFFYDVGKRGRGGQSLTEPNHWDSVLGVERAFGERVRLLVQALYRVHPSLRDPAEYVGTGVADTAVQRGIGRANALIQNYQEKSELGATFLAAYSTPEDRWAFEIAALGNFIGGDFLIRPRVTHKIRDSLHAALGLDYYGGPEEKTLGALRDYRSAFLEASLDF